MKINPRKAGFTIIEVVLAMFVLLIGMTTIIGLLSFGAATARTAQLRAASANSVAAVMADLEENLFPLVLVDGFEVAGEPYVYHRTPGFGDTDWTDVITILRQGGFQGSIDIEGWHDPVYRGPLEMTGQVHALEYLKQCRGGPFVENPTVGPK